MKCDKGCLELLVVGLVYLRIRHFSIGKNRIRKNWCAINRIISKD